MFGRNRLAIVVAEFLGTGALALVMLSVLHSAIGVSYFVAVAAGLMLALMTVVFARTGDGAHFNPAVTIGMWTTRQVKTLPAIAYIVAQMLGAWAAYYLYTYFVRTSLQATVSHFDAHILVAEAIGGVILALAYAAAVYNRFLNSKTAATIGAAYVLAIIVASSVAVGMSNPALSLGLANPAMALALRAFEVTGSNGWLTYALGPVLGAIIGFNLYALLYAPESSFDAVRNVVSERFVRARASSARVAAPEAKTEVPAPKSRTTTAKRTTRSTSRSRTTTNRRNKR